MYFYKGTNVLKYTCPANTNTILPPQVWPNTQMLAILSTEYLKTIFLAFLKVRRAFGRWFEYPTYKVFQGIRMTASFPSW